MKGVLVDGMGAKLRDVVRRRTRAFSRGGLALSARDHSPRLEDDLMNRPEGRRIFGVLAYVLGILFLRRFGARVSHAQRLEDLLPHEREEGPLRRRFKGGTDQHPAARRLPKLRSRLEQKGTIRKNRQR